MQDIEEKVKWYTVAAKLGHAWFQHQLSIMLITGIAVELNQQEGLKWLTKAAEMELQKPNTSWPVST